MRVAHFVQRYPPALGGSEAYFARLGHHLVDHGCQVTVFTTSAVDLEAFWSTRGRRVRPGCRLERGVEVRRYGLRYLPFQTRILRGLSLLLSPLGQLVREVGLEGPRLPLRTCQGLTVSCNPIVPDMWRDAGHPRERFDVVHATAFPYGWPLVCARRLARTLGVPFLLTPFLHLGDPLDPLDRTRRAYTSPALLSLAQSADRVFVQTAGERDALIERGIEPGRLILQGMGVDLGSCTGGNRTRIRHAWGVKDSEVVVGHLANNSKEKGSVDLLKAVERAWRHGSRLRVILAGPEMPNFQTFWNSFHMRCPAGFVHRLGVLTEEQKRDFFAGLDVFALPSRSDSFGLVLLEAWANGVPNVGYRAGGIGWVIRDGLDGLLVPCGAVDQLCQALLRLERDEDLRQRLGEAGRARLGEFQWEDKLGFVQRTCEEVVGSKGVGGFSVGRPGQS